jgi:dihydrofolate synthase/folylpolyglutamate synthase
MRLSDRLKSALSRLDQLVDWERSARASMRASLECTSDLLARLGNPERHFRSVHVTGTKGKGTVCALIEAGLFNAGCKVGRYASPHVDRINERVSHNLQLIEDDALAAALEAALDARDLACGEGTAGKEATWFDVLTAAACHSFRIANLDWVVVEVGIGGRLDSTNTIQPEIVVITNIGLEHTDVLGDTVELIAWEKAGIIKAGTELVTLVPADDAAGRVIQQAAKAKEVAVWIPIVSPRATIVERNAAVARTVLDRLGALGFASPNGGAGLGAEHLTDELVARIALPGRLERRTLTRVSRGGVVDVVIDGAHVAFAIQEVMRELKTHSLYARPPVVVLALAADKDAESIISVLAPITAELVCTALSEGKTFWTPDALSDIGVKKGMKAQVVPSPRDAFETAVSAAEGTWVLVIGSLHLAGKIRAILDAH